MTRKAPEMQDGIYTTTECAEVCLAALSHCLEMGGPHATAEHIRLLLDCNEACQLASAFMTRGSEMHAAACRLCAEVCAACAESCEVFEDDEEMEACADVCHRCADACRQMAGAAA